MASPLANIVITIVTNGTQAMAGLAGMAGQVTKFASGVQSTLGNVGKSFASIGAGTDAFGKKFGNFITDSIGKLARFTGYFLAVKAVTSILGGAISEMRDFDESLRNVQSITLESDASMKALAKDLLATVFAGKSAGFSASDLAKGMYELVSAGYSTDDALHLVEVAAKGAAAGLSSVDATSKLLLGILQAYHRPVADATEVMSQLFTIVDLGVVHFDDLATNMGYLIPTAAALGIPINQVGAAIELLTREGQTSSRVFTNINDVMTRLLKPNKELAEVIHNLGYASGSAMVTQLGFVGTVQALARAAENTTDAVRGQREEVDKLRISQEEANLAFADSKDRVKEAKFALEDAEKAAKGDFKTTREREEAQIRLRRAQRDYQKSLLEVQAAQDKVTKSGEEYNKGLKDLAQVGLQGADDKLAAWFGDVRAIRAILPLAANEGRDFNNMLAEHNKEASSGDRAQAALNEQAKSFNYQIRQLASNFKNLADIAGGYLLPKIVPLIKSANDLFHVFILIDPVTGKASLNLEKFGKYLDILHTVIRKVHPLLMGLLSPVILGVLGAIGGFFATIIGAVVLINPLTLVLAAIIAILDATGHLGDVWEFLKRSIPVAIRFVLKEVENLRDAAEHLFHFLSLGLKGGGIGGEHSFLEKLAFNIGKIIRETIPHVKAFVAEVEKLVHLLVLGFAGGQIGGEFSALEKAAFRAGQIIHQIIDFVQQKVVPFAIDVIVQTAKDLYAILLNLKANLEHIAASPSFRSFIHALWEGLTSLYGAVSNIVKAFVEFMHTPLGEFLIALAKKLAPILLIVVAISTGIGDIPIAILAIRYLFDVIDALVGWFHKAEDAVTDAWNAVKNFASSIGDLVGDIYNGMLAFGGKIANGIVDGVKGAISGANGIVDAIKAAINEAIDWINRQTIHIGIPAVKIHGHTVPGTGEGVDVHLSIPHLAKGVRDWMGGLAMLGEEGIELAALPPGSSVAPHDKTSQILDNLANGRGGGGPNVWAEFNVSVENFDEIKEKLYRQVDDLDRQLRYRAQRSGSALNGKLVQ